MKHIYKFIFISLFIFAGAFDSSAQCVNNNVLVSAVPANPILGGWVGWEENFPFTSGIASGEYVQVNVCAGATYTFTMCDNSLVIGDPEMTLRTTGGALIAYSDNNTILPFPGSLLPQITWTATFTGVVNIIIDQVPCSNIGGDWMTVMIYQLSNCGIGGGPATPCNADVGTFTYTQNGNPVTSPVYLCAEGGGDCFTFTSNDDYILSPPAANNPLEVPEVMWALYTCPPSGVDPALDPCYMGLTWTGEDFTDCNPSAFGLSGTIYFVPVTADDSDNGGNPNGVFNFDQDGDGCFHVGVAETMEVNWLNPIAITTTSDPCTGTITFTVTGGQSEYDASNYIITNNSNGTVAGLPVAHNGTFQLTSLNNGDGWSVTITDQQGCANTFTGTYVGDGVNPLISCPGNVTTNNDPGQCSAVVNYTVTFSDNCPSPVLTQTAGLPSGSSFPVGTTTNTFVVTDGIGNTATCSFTVTVIDNEAPTITCPGNQTVNNDPGNCSAVVNYNVTFADNCPGATLSQTAGLPSGSAFPVGSTINTFVVTDASGNTATCSFTVTVNDTENPTITCPANITVGNDPGNCSAVVNYNVTFADNCPGAFLTQTVGLPSGSTFPVGTTNNTFVVTDASGNTATCSFTVTVNDTENPTITCPGNIVVGNDPGSCDAVVNYNVTFADNCPGAVLSQTAGLPSGSTFPLGTTNNTFLVTDAAGNTATCSFTVTVNDTENPTITCPGNITVNNDPGSCDAVVNFNVTFADNCPGAALSQTAGLPSGSTFPVGTTVNTFLVTDAAGNTSTCSFNVTVNDTENPTITCPSNITVNNDPGGCTAVVNYNVTFADNCPGAILTQTAGLPSGSAFPAGTTNNTFVVTDASGNTATCSFTVTVNDTEDPSITCPGNIAQCNPVATWTAPVGTDNCPGPVTVQTLGPASGSTFPVGLTTIQYVVTDGSGNTDTCSFTVEIYPQDDPSFAYSSGTYCLTGTNPLPTSITTPGGTFTISAPGVINPTTGEINLVGSGLGSFTVYYNTGPAGNPCPNIDSLTITITAAPSAAFTYDQAQYCQDSLAPVIIYGPGASGGVFSANPAGLSLNPGTGAINLALSTPGLYTVYNNIAAAGGCAAALDSTTIEILPVDTAVFSYGSNTFCITGTDPTVTLGPNTTPGGVFTITAPGVINGANGTINLTGSGLGAFTVYYNTAPAGNPCPEMDSVTINIVSAPGATFTYNTPFCEGDTSLTLPNFAGNNFAGVFSASPNGLVFVDTLTGQIDLTASGAGTYMIYNNLPASGGCAAAVDSFQIVINPMYTVPLTAAICEGDSILLGGAFQTTAGLYTDSLLTTLGCDSIIQTTLTVNPVDTVPQTAAICAGDSVFLGGAFQNTAGTYYDTLTNGFGCDSILETTLTINTVIITNVNDSICQGDSILLGGAFQTTAGVYNDTLIAAGGCDSVVVTTLSITPQLSIVAMNDTTICSSGQLILTAVGSGTGTINWYTDPNGTNNIGSGSPLVVANPGQGVYTYYVNETGGPCPSNMDSVIVTVGGVTAVIGANPTSGAIPLVVNVDGTGSTGNVIGYNWDFGDGNTSNLSQTSNTYNNLGSYTITLIVTDGTCSDTATVTIDAFGESFILIPNVFTPNNDGQNDVFTIEGENLESVEVEIYNRWGQLMYSWDNVNGFWDGRSLSGSESPDGTYFYIVNAKGMDGAEYFRKGGFSLIR